MGTHDEETRRFFKHSSVQVLLCPRSAGKRHSWVKQQVTLPICLNSCETIKIRYFFCLYLDSVDNVDCCNL